jgi:pimeloyl-ACP methyl ester carboxylesterase
MAYRPVIDADLELSDGRNLAYCIWGDPNGQPIFLFHGSPGSRVFAPNPFTTEEFGIQLITVDRPGYGRSDPQPGRQLLDWTTDVEALAGSLGIDEFGVMGHSSGGPYALACAYAIPDRVKCVALISSVAPHGEPFPDPLSDNEDQALTRLAWDNPAEAAKSTAEAAAWLVETPERFLDLPRPEPDAQLLADPSIRSLYLNTVREAVKQGIDAYAWDGVLERRPWGFALVEIGTEIWIFQGAQDAAVLPSEADRLSAALPGSHLRRFPDSGHGLIVAHWSAILNELT